MKPDYIKIFLISVILVTICITGCQKQNDKILPESTIRRTVEPGPYHGGLAENKECIVNFFAGDKYKEFKIYENSVL
jgi:hypothetical protein